MTGPSAPATTRPPFARDFPRTPEVDALVDAFDVGDYARVRAGAARLVATSEDAEVRRAAATLRARTEPDPLLRWVFVATAALLVFLLAWWVAHDPPATRTPPPPPPPPIERVH